jgi:hypothetical protein
MLKGEAICKYVSRQLVKAEAAVAVCVYNIYVRVKGHPLTPLCKKEEKKGEKKEISLRGCSFNLLCSPHKLSALPKPDQNTRVLGKFPGKDKPLIHGCNFLSLLDPLMLCLDKAVFVVR